MSFTVEIVAKPFKGAKPSVAAEIARSNLCTVGKCEERGLRVFTPEETFTSPTAALRAALRISVVLDDYMFKVVCVTVV